MLALYVPQLTIPGYDDGLADLFDALMDTSRDDAYAPPVYSASETIDGGSPLCGETVAWRHPRFGNYTDRQLASSFVSASTLYYSRRLFSTFECLVWLLSDKADWMPGKLRETIIEGTRKRDLWFHDIASADNVFADALLSRTRSKFRLTKALRSGLAELVEAPLKKMNVNERPELIAERIISRGFTEGYYEERERIRDLRR